MKIRFTGIFPAFFLGITLSNRNRYYALGLGFWSLVLDGWMDKIEVGDNSL